MPLAGKRPARQPAAVPVRFRCLSRRGRLHLTRDRVSGQEEAEELFVPSVWRNEAMEEIQQHSERVSGELPFEERLAHFAAFASELPTSTGVYLMRGERGEILYVGKAKNLRARVRTYFTKGGDSRFQIHYLLRRVRKLDFVVTGTEKEAVILENNFIKKHKPRYNIVFRDDKTYLHVKLSLKDEWPRLYRVRRPRKDGAKHYGPYSSAASLRETLDALQYVFPLRTCSDHELYNRTRPCIEYEIGRCLAPCVGNVTRERYDELVRQVDLYLSGRREELIKQLELQMGEASEQLEFERAARLRDRIAAIRRTLERQEVDVIDDQVDRDVIATQEAGDELWVQILFIRGGQVQDSHGYALKRHHLSVDEALSQFLIQFYSDDTHPVPAELILSQEIEDTEVLGEWLAEQRGGAVSVHVPRRGRKAYLVELAARNAREAVQLRYEASERQKRVLDELREQLDLRNLPRRIECFDISHLQGGATAASQVTFINGEPSKNLYRKYEIRGIRPGDDYAAMQQVLTRRYSKALAQGEDPVPEADEMPDLIMVDGGKGQLGILEEVLKHLGALDLDSPPDRISLAKARVLGPGSKTAEFGRSDERVFIPGEKEPRVLARDSVPLLLLAHLRDESHRFALAYHRKLRTKLKFRSVLDDIPGIGKKRRTRLLKHLGSLEQIRQASLEELVAAPGMNRRAAESVWTFFHGPLPGESPAEGATPAETKEVAQESSES